MGGFSVALALALVLVGVGVRLQLTSFIVIFFKSKDGKVVAISGF